LFFSWRVAWRLATDGYADYLATSVRDLFIQMRTALDGVA
jgi:hypothetical protein